VIGFTGWDYQLLTKYCTLWSNLVGQLSVTNKLHGVESVTGCAGKEFFDFCGTQNFFTVFTAAFDTSQKYEFTVWNVTHVSFSWSAIRCQTCTGHCWFICSILKCRFVSLFRMKLESIISFCTWVVTLSARKVGLTYRGSCCFQILRTHLNRFEAAALHPAAHMCGICY
jgi:hypothetical protein